MHTARRDIGNNILGDIMKAYEYHSEAMKLAEMKQNESDTGGPGHFRIQQIVMIARIAILAMNYQMMGNLWGRLGEQEKQIFFTSRR